MHDFTDDISPVSSDNVPQNDERIEFDNYEEFRNMSDDAFRHY